MIIHLSPQLLIFPALLPFTEYTPTNVRRRTLLSERNVVMWRFVPSSISGEESSKSISKREDLVEMPTAQYQQRESDPQRALLGRWELIPWQRRRKMGPAMSPGAPEWNEKFTANDCRGWDFVFPYKSHPVRLIVTGLPQVCWWSEPALFWA